MIDEPHEAARTRNTMFLISAMAWSLLLATRGGMSAHCLTIASGGAQRAGLLGKPTAMSSPAAIAASWVLMLTAMMSPTLIGPMRYIQLRSFVRRRVRSITLFVIGYVALWMSVGCLLLGLQWLLEM